MRWFIAIPIQWLLGAAFVVLVGTWMILGTFWFWVLVIGIVALLIWRAVNKSKEQ